MTRGGVFIVVELESTRISMICLEMRSIFAHEIAQYESLGEELHLGISWPPRHNDFREGTLTPGSIAG